MPPTHPSQQFDLSFVEVHRVRRFRFTPRHCQSDSDLELLDLRDSGKHHQIFSHICRDHPACGCAPAYSSWNCDGEILNHTAIDVRYGKGVALSDWLLLNCSQGGQRGGGVNPHVD